MILSIVFFQEKLLLPTLCVSIGIGVAGLALSIPIIQGTGFGYILAGPLTHYIIYELRDQNEYYFYFNLGLNKPILYSSTVIINLIIGVLILRYA